MINSNNETSSVNSIWCDPIYFIETINNNQIWNFYWNVKWRDWEEIFNMEFYDFTTKLKDLYDFVTQSWTEELKYLEEIVFLSKYIDLLFKEAKKENWNLLSVFESEKDKIKLFELLPEYFWRNYHNKIMEIREYTPWFTKAETDKIDKEARDKIEKEKSEQERKDNEHAEKLKWELLTEDEKKAILTIFDEE